MKTQPPKAPKWVKCSERMPRVREIYYWIIRDGYQMSSLLRSDGTWGNGGSNVTHWLDCPDPEVEDAASFRGWWDSQEEVGGGWCLIADTAVCIDAASEIWRAAQKAKV